MAEDWSLKEWEEQQAYITQLLVRVYNNCPGITCPVDVTENRYHPGIRLLAAAEQKMSRNMETEQQVVAGLNSLTPEEKQAFLHNTMRGFIEHPEFFLATRDILGSPTYEKRILRNGLTKQQLETLYKQPDELERFKKQQLQNRKNRFLEKAIEAYILNTPFPNAPLSEEQEQALNTLPVERFQKIDTIRKLYRQDLQTDPVQAAVKVNRSLRPQVRDIDRHLLQRVVEKYLTAGSSIYFPTEEDQVCELLPGRVKEMLWNIYFEKFKEEKSHEEAAILERYMRLYLQRFNPPMQSIDTADQRSDEIKKHKQIRESFGPQELEVIDKMSGASNHWRQIATKPDILRLLGDEQPDSNRYQRMSEPGLYQRAEQASSDIYSATQTGGLMIFAPSGWGKSRLLGRSICYQHALNGIGTVVLDVVGGTIDEALDKIDRISPVSSRLSVAEKIRYCNMGGEHIGSEVYVTGWPMLVKRFREESLYTTSQRIVELIAKTDRNLSTASIQGLNRIAPLLTSIAILLAANGLPISRSFDLLEQPEQLQGVLERTPSHTAEVREAVQFLHSYVHLTAREQEQRSDVLRNKLSFLRFDSVSKAMFSARDPLIDWEEVAAQGLQVYVDFRGTDPMQVKELKLFWVWNSLMEYIKSRGAGGRFLPPLAVVIDELSYFVRGQQLNTEAITEEFRELVQVRRRNANILLTCATQERSELPPAMQSACLQLPSHLYGATSNPETAKENANRWFRKQPKRMRARGRLYLLKVGRPPYHHDIPEYLIPLEEIVDETPPAYMSYEDQEYEDSRRFLELPKGEWLLAKSPAEGVSPPGLEHITTALLDHGKWVREPVVSEMRRLLMQEHGFPVSQLPPDSFAAGVPYSNPPDQPAPPQYQAPPQPSQQPKATPPPPAQPGSIRHRRRSEQ